MKIDQALSEIHESCISDACKVLSLCSLLRSSWCSTSTFLQYTDKELEKKLELQLSFL